MHPMHKPSLITEQQELASLVEELKNQPLVAVDTESNSLFAYRERVCLIQFSIPDKDYLVDPLELEDLTPLGEIFSDKNVEKIFHAAEYDLLTLNRDFDFSFNNIFDTMVAARIVGWEKIGLGALLQVLFGVRLEKKFQKADWGKRPLTQKMLAYARLDTHYLIQLRNKLDWELDRADLWPLAKEDFGKLSQVDGIAPGPRKKIIWRFDGIKDLTPKQATVLQFLVDYRQQRAEKFDIPVFKVLSDKILVAVAALQPFNRRQLKSIPGMTGKMVSWHTKGLLAAVKKGTQEGPSYPPPRPNRDEDFIERLDKLKSWRKKRAIEKGVESDIVLPRQLMYSIASQNNIKELNLNEIMKDYPWRYEQYGVEIESELRSME